MAKLLDVGEIDAGAIQAGCGPTLTARPSVRMFGAPTESTRSAAQRTHARDAGSELTGTRVLVVEDDDDARQLFAAILENAGCVVTTASSAAEAFEALEQDRPQAIISDIGMPHEDGLSFMRRVRARSDADGGDIPSIALTAYTGAIQRTHALQAGFSEYLRKPVRANELLAALRDLTAHD